MLPVRSWHLRKGVDPGFLERGFIYIKVWGGVCLADFISFFLNILWKWRNSVLLSPNYFIFIGYLETGGRENPSGSTTGEHWEDPPHQANIRVNPVCLLSVDSTLPVNSSTMVNRNFSSWRVLERPKIRTHRSESSKSKDKKRKKLDLVAISSKK